MDGVTDPRNLGAVVRSAAAFDAHGVVVPQRRAVGMTASAWRTSAGAAARIPVARAVNLARALASYQDAGLQTVGLAGDGDVDLDRYDGFADPVALVVGAEGTGLSRLVREKCDVVVRIPIDRDTESLNVSVAAGIALYQWWPLPSIRRDTRPYGSAVLRSALSARPGPLLTTTAARRCRSPGRPARRRRCR